MIKKFFVMVLLIMPACKNSQQTTKDFIDINDLIEQQIGSKYEKIDRGPLRLCFSTNNKNIGTWKTVMVVEIKTSRILYGPKKLNADVSWYSDRKLLISETPEVIKDKYSATTHNYIYNLDTKRIEKNNNKLK